MLGCKSEKNMFYGFVVICHAGNIWMCWCFMFCLVKSCWNIEFVMPTLFYVGDCSFKGGHKWNIFRCTKFALRGKATALLQLNHKLGTMMINFVDQLEVFPLEGSTYYVNEWGSLTSNSSLQICSLCIFWLDYILTIQIHQLWVDKLPYNIKYCN